MSEVAYTSRDPRLAARCLSGEAGSGEGIAGEAIVGESGRTAVMRTLRDAIARIERHTPQLASPPAPLRWQAGEWQRPVWQLGCPVADQRLPGAGLAINAVHEVKGVVSGAGAAADWMTALGFALRLGVRRLEAETEAETEARAEVGQSGAKPFVLWCWPRVLGRELGRPSAAGLATLGLDPAYLVIVETARAGEALVAIEEGLRSGSFAAVIGALHDVALTPARRLSLAAATGATPCLLVTHPGSQAAGATATRWRIARAPSAAHPFDPRASGARRFTFEIERCRAPRVGAGLSPLSVEWSDEAHRFAVAAGLAGDLSRLATATGRAAG